MSQKLCREFAALRGRMGRPVTSTVAPGEFFAKSKGKLRRARTQYPADMFPVAGP
jgi:hypothetical protein